MRPFLFVAALATASAANAETSVCRFVEADARVGYPPNLNVTLSEHREDRVCRISVAGVAPDDRSRSASPENRQVLRDAVRDGGQVSPFELAAAVFGFLGAASPSNEDLPVPDAGAVGEALSHCFVVASEVRDGFATPADIGLPGPEDFGLRCAVANDDEGFGTLSRFLDAPVSLQAPTLAIARDRADGWYERLLVSLIER